MNLGDGKLKLLGTGLAALWMPLGGEGAPADAITVTPANPTIGVGQTQQFTANGALTPTAVAGGGFHACMRLPDGTVQCWGRNNFGQLGNGDGNLADSSVPVAVRGLTTATRVVTGDSHTCALLGDGTVQCWGVGDSGQRGDGTFNNISTVPAAVVGITGAGAVAARGYHSCALLGDGTVWCWGRNSDGQLGVTPSGSQCPTTPGFFCSSTPVRATGITSAAAVIAGGYHTCALFGDGTAQCWGRNDDGQLGDGTFTSSSTAVRVGGITGAVAVSAGILHTCALLANGTVKCWGAVGPNNDFGQLGNGATTGSSTPVTVTGTGVAWTSSNGAVATIDAVGRATGLNPGTATMTATGGSGASASTTHTATQRVALSVGRAGTGSGTASSSAAWISCRSACSAPYDRGMGVTLTAGPASGSTFTGWSGCDTVSGATCTVTMNAARVVTATFDLQRFTLTVNKAGLGSGTVTSSPPGINCGTDCSEPYPSGTVVTLTATPALLNVFTGWDGCDAVSDTTCTVTMSRARSVTALTTAIQAAAGDEFAGALLGDSTARCWGLGSSGQRGDGTFDKISTVPVAVVGITGAAAVSSGYEHACALLGDHSMRCWGRNVDGQLGNGIPLPAPPGTQCPSSWCSSTPVRVVEITSAAAITAGAYHTCALLPDRTVQCWGRNDDGQLGDGGWSSSSDRKSVV